MTDDASTLLDAARRGFAGLAVPEPTRVAALAHLRRWVTEPAFLPYVPQIRDLVARERWNVLLDSFYQVLPFGTGGRRGPVGVGPNRYNPWTLAASVQGHVTWLRERLGDRPVSVVIAYDVRRYEDAGGVYDAGVPNPCRGLSSRDFAEIAAGVYAANGVHTVLLAPGATTWVSTPELSFAIRYLKADGGLNISASHNPPDDNGGKFYNALGGQEVPPHDATMAAHVDRVDTIRQMAYAEARATGWVRDLPDDVHPAYVATNLATSLRPDARSTHVVFTALHGTGDTTVLDVLRAAGFRVDLEPTQATHDGRFPEVPFRTPNPEVRASMDRAVALAQDVGADLVMACDPDADRLGLQARNADGSFRFFTGNEIATLVTEYRLAHGRWRNPIVMKTEVTSEQVSRAARTHGAQVVGDLMVGFKYIGDGLRQLDAEGRFAGVTGTVDDFVVGCEESHGVLVTAALRDKDAAGAALALAEYASVLKSQGRTLVDALGALWERDGYVHNELVSTVMRGATGQARIAEIQAALRAEPPRTVGGLDVTEVHDRADPAGPLGPLTSDTDAASRNVLVFVMGDTARVILRPSGTEPKNKIYVEYKGRPGAPPATEIPRCTAAARALARDFAAIMLGRVGIVLPHWALRVSDLVAIEQKTHFAEVLMPGVTERLARGSAPTDPALRAWIDQELAAYGKDPRRLVADAVEAWCGEHPDRADAVRAALA
jgi:phosphoglucomutase